MIASWFRRKFSRRLAVAFSLVSVAAVFSTAVLVGNYFRNALLAELADSLITTTSIVEANTDKQLFAMRDSTRLDALSHFLSDASGARISFIAADGAVLGDSAVPVEKLPSVENHRDRPEVAAALLGAAGHAVRLSHTTGLRFLYAAVPARLGGQTVGVVRAAYPLTAIEAKETRVRRRTAVLMVSLLLAALLVALALASSLSRPVREMSYVARRLAEGDYETRVARVSDDEHGRLSESINHLAEQIQSTVQELSRDKGQLSAILANMTEGVVALDPQGRIIAINPALARVFSLDPAAVQGKQFLEALRHHQLDVLVRGVLTDAKPRVEEVRTFGPDERVFEAQAAPILEEGRFSGALIVLHDITRLRRLEQVRRDFVANVSHELRTPLASIKGFAETLEMGALTDVQNAMNFVQSIEKQADRMTALVEDLLDLSAIESGERPTLIDAVSLADLLEDVCQGLRPLANRKKVALTFQSAEKLPAVGGDRNQLRQIFVNLLENALKFTPAGSVTITARVEGDAVAVAVADTGLGIPTQDLDRIFERFYRVDKARSREMGGTGLGLSIVKHLVESHHGQVRVDSAVGRGSVFTVVLPLYKPA